MSRLTGAFVTLAALGALLGVIYSGISTSDFAAHLDRQLHPVSCSLLPGLDGEQPTQLGDEVQGCKVAMFSEWSSFWRDRMWGGVPVSLLGLGLFGFAMALCVWALIAKRGHEVAPASFLLLSGLVAAGVSLRFALLAMNELGTFCTTCVGTYIASGALLLFSLSAFFSALRDRKLVALTPREDGDLEPRSGNTAVASLVLAAELGLAVALPSLVYAKSLPDYTKHVLDCERLSRRDDPAGVLLPLDPAGDADAVMVLDPLCPACKAFHERLDGSPAKAQLDQRMLLFPLDPECNWMLSEAVHPGACLLSRALLCAGEEAPAMLDVIFAEQAELLTMGKRGQLDQVRDTMLARFPAVRECIDAPETTIKLNESLRFAVDNALPVTTPQLYVNGKRLCEADTDLGLEFAIGALAGKTGGGR
jgi:uncharacterized membrane protein